MRISRTLRSLSILGVVSLTAAACGGGNGADSDVDQEPLLRIATSFFPVTEIVTRTVEGLAVGIVQSTPPGSDVHGYELTARQLDDLSDSDVVFHLSGGLQPTIEKAVTQLPSTVTVVDLASSLELLDAGSAKDAAHDHDASTEGAENDHEHGDTDPHVWLDPANMAAMTREVAAALTQALPAESDVITTNADAYVAELDSLGSEMDATFADCASRTLVTSHDAFGYLAARVDLVTVPIAGIDPENEPSARELEAIAETAREAGASTVFFETQLPDALARTVAASIGAGVSVISAAETMSNAELEAGDNYLSRMRATIATIAEGLGCT